MARERNNKKNHLYQNNLNLAHSSCANRTRLSWSAKSRRCGRQFRGRSTEATRCFHSATLAIHCTDETNSIMFRRSHGATTVACRRCGTKGIFRLRVREAGSEAWVSDSGGIPNSRADAHLECNFVRKLQNQGTFQMGLGTFVPTNTKLSIMKMDQK